MRMRTMRWLHEAAGMPGIVVGCCFPRSNSSPYVLWLTNGYFSVKGTSRNISDPVVHRKISQRSKFIKCITGYSPWTLI